MSYILRQLDRAIDQLETEIGGLLDLIERVEDNKADLDSRLRDACRERAETIAWRVKIARELQHPAAGPTEAAGKQNEVSREVGSAEEKWLPFDGTGYFGDDEKIVWAPV